MTSGPPRRVVVVGGGITGLAAAYALQERARGGLPVEVTLLEASSRLGGKILTERVDGFTLEAGPDSLLTTKPAAVDLCIRLGLGDLLVGTGPDRIVYVLHRGRLHPLPGGLALGVPLRLLPLLRSRLFSLREKLRIGLDLLLPAAPDSDDEALGPLLRRRFGPAMVERLAGPLLSGIYAGDIDRLSVRAILPHLADLERQYGSLIRGMRAQRAGAVPGHQPVPEVRRTRSGRAVPGTSPPSMFVTLRGGVGVLVDRLAASLTGTTLQTSSPVRAISTDPARPYRGYVVHIDRGAVLADAVILAAPAPAAADLLGELSPRAADLLRRIPYASTSVVALGYRSSEVTLPMGGHGFVVARGEGYHLSACTWMSSKWPGCAPPGHVLLRCYVGHASDDAAPGLGERAIVALVRRELRAIMGIAADPVLIRVYRWEAAMPQYLLGHLPRLEMAEAALADAPGVMLAGAAYRGVGIPDCVRQGIQAAERVAQDLRRASPAAGIVRPAGRYAQAGGRGSGGTFQKAP